MLSVDTSDGGDAATDRRNRETQVSCIDRDSGLEFVPFLCGRDSDFLMESRCGKNIFDRPADIECCPGMGNGADV